MTTLQQLKQKKIEEFEGKFCLMMQTSEKCDKCGETHLIKKHLGMFSKMMQDRGKNLKTPLIISDEALATPEKVISFLSSAMDKIQNATIENVRREIGNIIDETIDISALAANTPEAQIHNSGWENCKHHISLKYNSALNNLKMK